MIFKFICIKRFKLAKLIEYRRKKIVNSLGSQLEKIVLVTESWTS